MSLVLPFIKRRNAATVDWDALYADHIERIYNFFRYRVGDELAAEDLTAITFEKAWKRRRQFRGDADRFIYWLYAIARNVANDYFRKRPNTLALDEALVSQDGGPSEAVEQRAEFALLVHHIRQLPERERDIISLKYGADLNNRQIARQLQLSESNVGSILHRTINKLRRQMESLL